MKKMGYILFFLIILFFGSNFMVVKADEESDKDVAMQMAKILYNDTLFFQSAIVNLDESFFSSLTMDSIILNNTSNKFDDGSYKKIYNLTNSNYRGYNTYKDSSFDFLIVDVCTNHEILKVIYFILTLIDIVKFVVPMALIVIGMLDLAKCMISGDDSSQKKNVNLFIKRLVYAMVIFLVPVIVKFVIVFLGDLATGVNFTDCIDNANLDKITQLEKEMENNNSSNDSNKDNDQGNSNTKEYNYIVYVGDSRTVEMCDAVKLSKKENCGIAKVGAGYSWLSSDTRSSELASIIKKHPKSYIVINMGTNSALTTNEGKQYAEFYNEVAKKYPDSKVVAVSVTQINASLAKRSGMYYGINISDDSVSVFNKGLKNNLDSKVKYCDVYTKMKNYDYVLPDGVHYNDDTYNFIYGQIQDCLK